MIDSITYQNSICFVAFREGVEKTFVNSIRRSIMLHVENVGVDRVIIHENSSAFPCELLVKRLSLVPFVCTEIDQPIRFCVHGPCDFFSDQVVTQSNEHALQKGVFLFKLMANQTFSASIFLKMGNGEDHVRFSHVYAAAIRTVSKTNTDMTAECNCGINSKKGENGNRCVRCGKPIFSDGQAKHHVLTFGVNTGQHVDALRKGVDALKQKVNEFETGI